MQHLTALQSLHIKHARVSTAEGEYNDMFPVLNPAPQGLTSLELLECTVRLQGLSALTNLQNLVVTSFTAPLELYIEENQADIAEASKRLQKLTALHLGWWMSEDPSLVNVSSLMNLQHLHLSKATCKPGSLSNPPVSLKTVIISMPAGNKAAGNVHVIDFSPDSMPILSKPTALEELTVTGSDCSHRDPSEFHVTVLTGLTSLSKLSLSSCEVTARPGEPTLVVLKALTRLQALKLHRFNWRHRPAVSDADFAALTSSSQQLTYLDLIDAVDPQHLDALLPGGLYERRRLPTLQRLCCRLCIDTSWLDEFDVFAHLMDACHKLQQLRIDAYGAVEKVEWADSLSYLKHSDELTSLEMLLSGVSLTPAMCASVAALTGLQELTLEAMSADDLGVLLQLTACKQLSSLNVEVHQAGHPHHPLNERQILLCFKNKVS